MALERASEAARRGDVNAVAGLSEDELHTVVTSLDEDGR